jgi:hypothetical protein
VIILILDQVTFIEHIFLLHQELLAVQRITGSHGLVMKYLLVAGGGGGRILHNGGGGGGGGLSIIHHRHLLLEHHSPSSWWRSTAATSINRINTSRIYIAMTFPGPTVMTAGGGSPLLVDLEVHSMACCWIMLRITSVVEVALDQDQQWTPSVGPAGSRNTSTF